MSTKRKGCALKGWAVCCAVWVGLVWGSTATAQDSPDELPPIPVPGRSPPTPIGPNPDSKPIKLGEPNAFGLEPASWARANDIANPRGILASRADTLEAGRLSLTTYALVAYGASYGLSDDLQLTVVALPVIFVVGGPVLLAAGAKWALLHTENTVLSVGLTAGSATFLDYNLADEPVYGGLFPSLWIDHHIWGGDLVLHGAFTTMSPLVFASQLFWLPAWVGRVNGGATLRLGKHVRWMSELSWGWATYDGSSGDQPRGWVTEGLGFFTTGVRFHGPSMALDVSAIRYLEPAETEALWFPYASFSYGL